MRIKVIFISHENEDFIEEQKRYRESLVSSGTAVEITSIKEGPETIEQNLDEILAAPGILHEVKLAEKEGADAVVVDCALDPVLSALRECVRIPVIGAGQAAFSLAITLGERFAIIAPLRCLLPAYRRRVSEYGLLQHLASIRSIDIGIFDLLCRESLEAFIKEGALAVEKDGADVIVLGCTGMSPVIPEIKKQLDVPVIDPAAAAISLAETLIKMNLSHSPRSFPYKILINN